MVELLGYEKAQEIAARAIGKPVREVVLESGLMSPEQFDTLISPESLARLGSPPREEKP
jgi:fumarate hydratase class II